jgi:hypothetical protein
VEAPSNMRVQRTRRLALLGRSLRSLGSPRTRHPLGVSSQDVVPEGGWLVFFGRVKHEVSCDCSS